MPSAPDAPAAVVVAFAVPEPGALAMHDADQPHSERYFTDARDYWWHADYLALMARRLALPAASQVLEVGVGQGHFARALAPHLPAGFSYTGLDPEARSLQVAQAQTAAMARAGRLDGRFAFREGVAEALPFADDSFDLVTCQTVLIHLADPAVGFAEMVRVCRPGGVILACEPNNLAATQRLALRDDDGQDPFVEVRFAWRCTRGKARLGLGDNNLGIRLPALFAELVAPRYAMNDRPWVLASPYEAPQAAAHRVDLAREVRERVYGWPRDEARRYYLAGGGDLADFERDYEALLVAQDDEHAAMEGHRWVELNAPAMLLAWGRKPHRET
jgi:SAM-dependent methyltransferase